MAASPPVTMNRHICVVRVRFGCIGGSATRAAYSEGWWPIAFGDERVVESAFCSDAAGLVLGAAAPALGIITR